jgi:hypothetical protein
MSRRFRSSSWGIATLTVSFTAFAIAACSSAGGGKADGPSVIDPDGDGMPNVSPSATSTGTTGTPNTDNTGPGGLVTPDMPVDNGPGCQQAAREFTPKTPSVFVVVDRSGSMFQNLDNPQNLNPPPSPWTRLREGVLPVLQELQAGVNIGFGAFVGATAGTDLPYVLPASAGTPTCLDMQPVAPALNNQAAIAALYNSMARPTDGRQKETPTVLALNLAAQQLWNVQSDGDRYILFVTDGEPDYCDDPFNRCAVDSVVARLQQLSAGKDVDAQGAPRPPIRTLVFSITAPGTSIPNGTLQAFANAGAGQPVLSFGDPVQALGGCNQAVPWQQDMAAAGKVLNIDQSVGDYVLTGGGTATFYRPDANDQAALTEQIRVALAEVKSCTFDLAGDGVKVDVTREDLGEKAVINLNGSRIALDPVNGWSMASETTVQLNGTACTAWRDPGETSIDFDFPCDVIIIIPR